MWIGLKRGKVERRGVEGEEAEGGGKEEWNTKKNSECRFIVESLIIDEKVRRNCGALKEWRKYKIRIVIPRRNGVAPGQSLPKVPLIKKWLPYLLKFVISHLQKNIIIIIFFISKKCFCLFVCGFHGFFENPDTPLPSLPHHPTTLPAPSLPLLTNRN